MKSRRLIVISSLGRPETESVLRNEFYENAAATVSCAVHATLESNSIPHSSDIFKFPSVPHDNVFRTAPKPVDGDSCLRTRLPVLGLDLSRHRHRSRDHSSRAHVWCALFHRRRSHARRLCRHRTPDFLFAQTDRPRLHRRPPASDGRQPHSFLRRTHRFLRPGRTHRRHHAAVVSGARPVIARRPPHFPPRQSRTLPRYPRPLRPGLAATAIRYHGPPRILGLHQPDHRIILLGPRLSPRQALAVRHGRL